VGLSWAWLGSARYRTGVGYRVSYRYCRRGRSFDGMGAVRGRYPKVGCLGALRALRRYGTSSRREV
jgi:hypothetical protein